MVSDEAASTALKMGHTLEKLEEEVDRISF